MTSSERDLVPKRVVATRDRRFDPRAEPAPVSAMDPLRRGVGNRATGLLLQAKLVVGAPNDRYEQEADRVADLVMRSPQASDAPFAASTAGPMLQRCACGGTCTSCGAHEEDPAALVAQRVPISPLPSDRIQRDATDSCAVKEEGADPEEVQEHAEETEATGGEEEAPGAPPGTPVQPKRYAGATATAPDDVEDDVNALRGQGSPLPLPTRQLMESRFGHDFSSVRVHTGLAAQGLNRDLHALAFTTGTDIYFAPGQFQPATHGGQHLLAHELTHVVQQSGGRVGGIVREKADPRAIARQTKPEEKWYYKHVVSGDFVHYRIERILRGVDADLVTEAAIPGADRFSPALNKIGVADLYKSNPTKTVTGVKGLKDVATAADVIAMNNPTAVGTHPTVASSPTIGGRRDAPVRSWSGDFPQSVSLGEIKPLSASKVAAGLLQLDSYEHGYKDFVSRIHALSGSTRASIGVARLAVKIPSFLDFDHWATEHTKPAPQSTVGSRRLWVASIGNALYLYFDLAADYKGPPPDWYKEQLRQMREVRKDLGGGNHPRTEKMEALQGKFLPGGPKLGRDRVLQRSTKDRPANYWPDRGTAWEKARAAWGKQFRSALKTRFKAYREKMRIEKKLGRTSRSAPAAEKTEAREYGQLMFWSGLPGRFLGKVRFLLGTVWDKILGVFERMKERMHGIRQKVKATSETGFFSTGWRKTLIKILVKAAKVVAIKFITESFNFFVECFHAAMDKVVAKIQAELTERFAEELCRARKFFEDAKDRLENEWGISLKKLQELLEVIQSAKHWVDIATGLIQLIRLGVQVISCLTPPALGCLWGLVAQIGISAGLDLLIGTQWFNDNIVTPTVRDLVRTYATPLYQRLINRALGDSLKEYHCHIADQAFPQLGFSFPGGLTGAELVAHRDNWEAQNQDAILKDLQSIFQKGKGRKASKEELQQLAEELKKSQRTAEELKKLLEASRDPLTGRLKLEVAAANVRAGELPPAEREGGGEGGGKERKIDYPKATKRNKELQASLHWDPMTFYKKPGVAVDSEEFADGVYDMQEALRIQADGILGEQTLIAFYDRNKLKADAAYQAAVARRDERKAARDKAAREKAEKASKGKASKQEGGDIVAIGVGKPPAGSRVIEDRYPTEFHSDPGWLGVPFGAATPELSAGGSYAPGQMLTVGIRLWLEGKYVWFTDIPAAATSMSSMNGRRMVNFRVAEDFYFKIAADAAATYRLAKGDHLIYLD